MADKHDVNHQFMRFETSNSQGSVLFLFFYCFKIFIIKALPKETIFNVFKALFIEQKY
jgi:hypothetical protein